MRRPIVGNEVAARGITGRVETIVEKGERFPKHSGRYTSQPYYGESFAVVRDDAGRAHHVLLSEIRTC